MNLNHRNSFVRAVGYAKLPYPSVLQYGLDALKPVARLRTGSVGSQAVTIHTVNRKHRLGFEPSISPLQVACHANSGLRCASGGWGLEPRSCSQCCNTFAKPCASATPNGLDRIRTCYRRVKSPLPIRMGLKPAATAYRANAR
jgi:hypothetical protein